MCWGPLVENQCCRLVLNKISTILKTVLRFANKKNKQSNVTFSFNINSAIQINFVWCVKKHLRQGWHPKGTKSPEIWKNNEMFLWVGDDCTSISLSKLLLWSSMTVLNQSWEHINFLSLWQDIITITASEPYIVSQMRINIISRRQNENNEQANAARLLPLSASCSVSPIFIFASSWLWRMIWSYWVCECFLTKAISNHFNREK